MIKTLRRKFIAIAMCSVVVVLGVIMGVINLTNYCEISRRADERLDILEENHGAFPVTGDALAGKPPPRRDLSPEVPHETRFFTVILRVDETVVSVNTGRIAAVDTATAADYAVSLYAADKMDGFLGDYKYRATPSGGGVMYIFLDCGRELDTFRSFLLTSCLVALLGMLLVFILVVFFSRLAVRPVAESYEKQKRFITDASHEIKTPLAIIDANAEVLELEHGESDWTKSIQHQIRRLNALTEKLVFLSRMDEDGAKLHMAFFSLSDAVLETAQPFEALVAAQGKRLCLEVEADVSYEGDEALIRQLLSLLLDNALKYSDRSGAITLRLRTAGRHRELTLSNTTAEMEQGRLDILFERFYRRDASRSAQTGGHGIGLSAAKSIVTAHGGKICARSDDGKTIVFTVLL